ncbi:hypothetical protein A8C75_13230 [Marinobacterium aestuarii]|uniref:Uncharacterized protein n=2 Tax=Marinobacterium aestuarii TaxID=1821621 RepID=A0A1A9F0C9_9GAMM|nr:hypothetical protein A8C75_13230 [Marinobacterium aestuarii]
MEHRMRQLISLLTLSLLFLASPLYAQDLEIEAFYGHFTGIADAQVAGEAERRQLSVRIEPKDDNFEVAWGTQVKRADLTQKEHFYRILFRKTRRGAIYASAMRMNVFGKHIPMDPLAGDPFVWARIHDKTLTVYAMMITNQGAYDMQIYDRTLRDDGDMDLAYTRILDGAISKEITASLKREPL